MFTFFGPPSLAPQLSKRNPLMAKDAFIDQCTDPTQELIIKIPCRLAERVKDYADRTNTTMEGVVIEALDLFLRGQKTPPIRR